ncbi:hypothetical protein ID866_13078 [Astraeus odoratus]|nr:hypothetical protein ID866_13078 [Astraeus odoratus]
MLTLGISMLIMTGSQQSKLSWNLKTMIQYLTQSQLSAWLLPLTLGSKFIFLHTL